MAILKDHRFWVGPAGRLPAVVFVPKLNFRSRWRRRSVTRGRQWQARTRLPHVVDSRRSPVAAFHPGRDQNGDKAGPKIPPTCAVLDDETSWGRGKAVAVTSPCKRHGNNLAAVSSPPPAISQRVAVNPIPPGVSRLPFLLAPGGTPPYRRSPASGRIRRPGGHRRMRGTWPPRPVRPRRGGHSDPAS